MVYTALFGGYEKLRPQPAAERSDITFYCFTDDPSLTSEHWTVVPVEPIFRHDPVRSARALKTIGHTLLDAADETLWIDNRVELSGRPEDLFEKWLSETDLCMVEHSFRSSLLDEFTAVADAGLDDTTRVWEYYLHTAETHPTLLDLVPLWTGMIARRRSPEIIDFGHRWFSLINRYSRRDQLSVLQAVTEARVDVRRLQLDNRESVWHRWPAVDAGLGRRPAYHEHWQNAMRPPSVTAAALRERNLRLERRVQELEDSVSAQQDEQARLGELINDAKSRSSQADAELAEVTAKLADALDEASVHHAEMRELKEAIGARRRANDRLREELRLSRRDVDAITRSRSYRFASAIARARRGNTKGTATP